MIRISQKQTRDEIIQFLKREGKVSFEQLTNDRFNFKRHFDVDTLNEFLQLAGTEKRLDNLNLLDNLGVLQQSNAMRLNCFYLLGERVGINLSLCIRIVYNYYLCKKMNMSDKELKKFQKKFETFKKKTLDSKESALKFLKEAGIYDSNGKLSKAYK